MNTYVLLLIVLEDTAQRTLRGTQRRVQHMHIRLLHISRLLHAVPDLQLAGLVVRAVGARHELLVLALEGEPGLEIPLLGRSVVEGARDDGHDLIRDTERLVEFFRGVDHVVECFPGFLGVDDEELFDLES